MNVRSSMYIQASQSSQEVVSVSSAHYGPSSTEQQWHGKLIRRSCKIFGTDRLAHGDMSLRSIWTGVQSWIGGQCVVLLLRSLAPSYANLPNSMPASSGTTTRDFVGFFLFILMHIPCVWLPVEKVRHFFTVKAIVAPIAGK